MPAASPPARSTAGRRRDLLAAGLAAALITAAVLVGRAVNGDDILHVRWPPLSASWDPHLGPATLAALTVAVAVVAYGPGLADRLPWRRLLLTTWAASMAWIWSLALVDGWRDGVTEQLTRTNEYARPETVARFADLGHAVRTFTDHILIQTPDNWPAHIAGHPPGAVLTFVGLDRAGLDGGAWAAAFCITVGGSAAVGVLVALRALGGEDRTRRAAPFLVLGPWAVWAGVSADGYFAAVAAWGLALLALAATRTARRPAVAATGAGLLLGWTVYLSYGLTLLVLPMAAVLWCAARGGRGPAVLRTLPWVVLGALPVAVAFTAAGFWWWEGYTRLHERYYQGFGGERPYSYWVWANLAVAALSAGLAAVAGARRAVRTAWPRRAAPPAAYALAAMAVAGLACIVAADLSGLSKAETERIWLPFTLWLLPAAALLPARDHRAWLAAQAAVALAVNHLLVTSW
ncbi:hypothetical protein O7599_22295 [Streptomyces sp. WMMC500]|uniref:hypothetical protein n=1 Tax=Streptomyces sp. WMMC500 TaxID=3015154 RepID=UPI00248B5EC1|nr:hypothetical protein [Streptomyces sp. WMMC500]WBB64585.1 hypothetical protein O7599_22295 [Streptomyces sp. WMMC500]